MNHSIITQYQDDLHQFSPSALNSKHLISKSPQRQTQDLYTTKLQTKVKQLKNNIRKNKPLIQQLKAQRKFLKKIYEKQKCKIQGIKIDLIKVEYENQIELLRHQRHKLQDFISVIHEQSGSKARDFVEAKQQININFHELSKALEEIRNQNRIHEQMLINKTEAIDMKKTLIAEIETQIKSKLSVQKKYKDVMHQIQQIQRNKNTGNI